MTVLMPKATAVWLIENSGLTFEQIGAFCGLHPLEVQGIANEEVARGIRGVDPISGGSLSREEIAKGEANPDYRMKAMEQRRLDLPERKRKGARFVPVARRQDRPDAIAWFVRNHPEVSDAQIVKLIGTTKSTIESVRNRTHWNSSQIKPVDPVSLGLCSQIELDAVVTKAAEAKAKAEGRKRPLDDGPGLRPAAETTRAKVNEVPPAAAAAEEHEDDPNADHAADDDSADEEAMQPADFDDEDDED